VVGEFLIFFFLVHPLLNPGETVQFLCYVDFIPTWGGTFVVVNFVHFILQKQTKKDSSACGARTPAKDMVRVLKHGHLAAHLESLTNII